MLFFDNNLASAFSGLPDPVTMPWRGMTQAGSTLLYNDASLDLKIADAQSQDRYLFVDVEKANLDAKFAATGDPQYDCPAAPPKAKYDFIETWQIDRCKYVRDADPEMHVGAYVSNDWINAEAPDVSRYARQQSLLAPDGVSPGLFVYADFIFFEGYYVNPAQNVANYVALTIDRDMATVMPYYGDVSVLLGLVTNHYPAFDASRSYVAYATHEAVTVAAESIGCRGVIWSTYKLSGRTYDSTAPYVQFTLDYMRRAKSKLGRFRQPLWRASRD